MQTKIIAIANDKGGVAKTTTALTLGVILARRGLRVLLTDLDAQCSLTENFIRYVPEKTVYDAFLGPKTAAALVPCIVEGTSFEVPLENVDLLPSSKWVKDLDMMLAAKTQHEKLLWKIFRGLEVGKYYDVVIIDCPPSLGLLTKNALVACDELYVPTTAEYTPVAGLVKLQEECEEIAEELNPGLAITGIIVTRYNKTRNLNVAADESLRQSFGDVVFKTRIRENIRIAESPQRYTDVVSYAPDSNGAKDYLALADEVAGRLGL